LDTSGGRDETPAPAPNQDPEPEEPPMPALAAEPIPTPAQVDAQPGREVPHRGDVIRTRLTDAQALLLLRRRAARGHQFSRSILGRPLGHRPWGWVHLLAAEELEVVRGELAAAAREAAAPAAAVGDLAAVMALFRRAGEHLRRPRVRLRTPAGSAVVLSLLGDRSRNPGSIGVTDGGRHGESRYWGRIASDGTLRPGRDPAPDGMLDLLRRFAADPAGVAAEYGRLVGRCCFCGTRLTDGRSTAVGYGETCAGHYGLAWGEARTDLAAEAQAAAAEAGGADALARAAHDGADAEGDDDEGRPATEAAAVAALDTERRIHGRNAAGFDLAARCTRDAYRVHECRGGSFTVLRYSPEDADEVVVCGAATRFAARERIAREFLEARRQYRQLTGRPWAGEAEDAPAAREAPEQAVLEHATIAGLLDHHPGEVARPGRYLILDAGGRYALDFVGDSGHCTRLAVFPGRDDAAAFRDGLIRLAETRVRAAGRPAGAAGGVARRALATAEAAVPGWSRDEYGDLRDEHGEL
jgi:hypothetical protein